MLLSELAKLLNGTLTGKDGTFSRVTIDSRSVQANDCFFAIKGDFFDGHDFITDVAKKNASVAIIDHAVSANMPLIRVANTREALKNCAKFYRENMNIPVAAITGSCGKTTTRALLENILKQSHHVLASKKSFNNDIGLPLTLLQWEPSYDCVVLEIGTNHPGEIAALTAIAKPTIAAITLVATVHVENFDDVAGIAREKGAILTGLTHDGTAVINADDEYAPLWKTMAGQRRVTTFGIQKQADVMAKNIQMTSEGRATFTLVLPTDCVEITLPLLGEHNVINALCAAAMACGMPISTQAIQTGLETAHAEYGRLIEKGGLSGATLIDDSYNANPLAVKAAIQLLTHRSSQAILVLGDMAELGCMAEAMHREIGAFARTAGVKQLFCLGKNSVFAAEAFGQSAQHFMDHQTLIDYLKKFITKDVTVLVKGSRSMKMEKIVEGLL